MILFCVDGTGPDAVEYWDENSAAYAAMFQNSFVNKLFATAASMGASASYHRGPALAGLDTGWYTGAMVGRDFIRFAKKGRPGDAIVLLGYSRGGTSVIATAKELVGEYTIDYMVLLDAVAMMLTGFLYDSIPKNVKEVLHLRRDPSVNSRSSWGNSGTSYSWKNTDYTEYFYRTTHAGMGFALGDPGNQGGELVHEHAGGDTNITRSEEKAGSDAVWTKLQRYMVEGLFKTY